MPAMYVWIDSITPDENRVLVWKNNCFYSAKVTDTDPAAWEERLRDAHDPAKVLGEGCQVAPIQLVSRVEYVLGNQVRIFYGKNGMQEIKLLVVENGEKLLDAVKESRPDWRHDLRRDNPVVAGLKGFGAFLVLALFFGAFYFLIEYQFIERAHWAIALIVNVCGTLPLLILAGLMLLLGFVVGGLLFVKPTETHVLRPSS